MINARELRIGNLLQDSNGDIFSALAFNTSSVWIEYLVEEKERSSTLELDIENVFPVALTEKWLLRFGFEENPNHEHPSFDEYRLPQDCDFAIGNYNDEYWIVDFLDQTYGSPEIKYVHQLQNLYFALTGEELIIKSE